MSLEGVWVYFFCLGLLLYLYFIVLLVFQPLNPCKLKREGDIDVEFQSKDKNLSFTHLQETAN